jgi:hypothetical protein
LFLQFTNLETTISRIRNNLTAINQIQIIKPITTAGS